MNILVHLIHILTLVFITSENCYSGILNSQLHDTLDYRTNIDQTVYKLTQKHNQTDDNLSIPNQSSTPEKHYGNIRKELPPSINVDLRLFPANKFGNEPTPKIKPLLTQTLAYRENGFSNTGSRESVPGVINLPTSGASGAEKSQQKGSGETKKKRKTGSSGQHNSGEKNGKNNQPPDNNPPPSDGKKRRKKTAKKTEYLRKTVISGAKTNIFRTELNEHTIFYKCMVCLGFVRWEDDVIDTCMQCSHTYCSECYSLLHPKNCPHCRAVNWGKMGLMAINAIQWECEKCFTEGITIPDMERHTRSCREIRNCPYEGCQLSDYSDQIALHESKCEFRPVKIGPCEFPKYQFDFIQKTALEPPSGEDVNNWPPGVAAQLLLQQLQLGTEAESSSQIAACPACKKWMAKLNLDKHAETCPEICVPCNLCDELVPRKTINEHKQQECSKSFTLCVCKAQVLLKNLDNHLANKCTYREIYCPNEDCVESFLQHELDGHLSVCPKRPVTCDTCRVKLPFTQMKETHTPFCTEKLTFDGKMLYRQPLETNCPVYETADGSFVYMVLPINEAISECAVNPCLFFGEKCDIGLYFIETNPVILAVSSYGKSYIFLHSLSLLDSNETVLGKARQKDHYLITLNTCRCELPILTTEQQLPGKVVFLKLELLVNEKNLKREFAQHVRLPKP